MARGRFPYGPKGSQITPALHDIGGAIVYGDVYFVDSNHAHAGTSANEGTKDKPFSTINSALGQCTGDETIYLAPGHAENITSADQIDADVIGVSIIGCGNGTRKATLTYTVAAGEFVIGASNVHIENIRFVAGAADVLKCIDIEDGVDYTTIKNCEFTVTTDGTHEFASTITLADNNIGTRIEDCIIDNGLGNATNGIHMDNATGSDSNTVIVNNRIQGDYSTACITADTSISVEILVKGNILQNGRTGAIGTEPAMELAASTGILADNYIMLNLANNSASIVATAAALFNNWYTETVGTGVGIADTFSDVQST